MKLGISEYKAGDFANASGHLGAALSTDYNNPTLHYYLANSYIKLGQKDGAIREFRIAYALQPKGEIAQYSKQALSQLGAAVAGGRFEGAREQAGGSKGEPETGQSGFRQQQHGQSNVCLKRAER